MKKLLIKIRIINLVLICVFVGLFLVRLFFLQADPPTSITWSGEFYTDEGWWARNSVTNFINPDWFIKGDYNPAINLPIFTVCQVIFFKVFGVGIVQARLLTVFFFAGLLFFSYKLINFLLKYELSFLTILLLVSNFFFFSYSRLALLEIPMLFFCVSSLYLLIYGLEKELKAAISVSAALFFCSVFIKTTALFLTPVLIYCFISFGNVKKRKKHFLVFLTTIFVLIITLYLVLLKNYFLDFRYFWSLNISQKVQTSLIYIVKGFFDAFITGFQVIGPIYLIIIGFCAIVILKNKKIRKEKLLWIMVIWFFSYLLFIGAGHYFPLRYYLPLLFPLLVILPVISKYILKKESLSKYILVLCIILYLFSGGIKIGDYITNTNTSFLDMTRDMQKIMDGKKGGNQIILGNFSNSIGLFNKIFTINDQRGVENLNYRIKNYKPSYYVSLGPIDNLIKKEVTRFYRMKLIKTYDVLNNYYNNKPVYFYSLEFFSN